MITLSFETCALPGHCPRLAVIGCCRPRFTAQDVR